MILNLTRPKARPGVFLFLRPEAGPRGFKVNSPVGDPWPKDEKDPEPVFFDGESNLIIFVDSLAVQGNCLWPGLDEGDFIAVPGFGHCFQAYSGSGEPEW